MKYTYILKVLNRFSSFKLPFFDVSLLNSYLESSVHEVYEDIKIQSSLPKLVDNKDSVNLRLTYFVDGSRYSFVLYDFKKNTDLEVLASSLSSLYSSPIEKIIYKFL